ncbi:MAG: thioredoxin domain-containing protein [Candidatus Phlomobacter fragariae]
MALEEKQVIIVELSEKKPLLVYFFCSWCGICRFTSPKIAQTMRLTTVIR